MGNEEYEWIIIDQITKYRVIGTNGEWIIIKFYGDAAIYSFCGDCGFTHSCSKHPKDKDGFWRGPIYDCSKEFIYCPTCGKQMINEVTHEAD